MRNLAAHLAFKFKNRDKGKKVESCIFPLTNNSDNFEHTIANIGF